MEKKPGEVVNISAYQKIPVYVFLENNLEDGESEIRFLTLDPRAMFECMRSFLQAMVNDKSQGILTSYTYEVQMLSPNEVNDIQKYINARNQEIQESFDSPVPVPPKIKRNLTLVKSTSEPDHDPPDGYA